MCRSCTLPDFTHGLACSQNRVQYWQFGSLNRYTTRGASLLPSAIQALDSIFAQTSLAIGAYTSFCNGSAVRSLPLASYRLPSNTCLPSGVRYRAMPRFWYCAA
ncbi:hypothetical protein D3C71_1816160 [compost metagenome]